jgi:hypothetical protein
MVRTGSAGATQAPSANGRVFGVQEDRAGWEVRAASGRALSRGRQAPPHVISVCRQHNASGSTAGGSELPHDPQEALGPKFWDATSQVVGTSTISMPMPIFNAGLAPLPLRRPQWSRQGVAGLGLYLSSQITRAKVSI